MHDGSCAAHQDRPRPVAFAKRFPPTPTPSRTPPHRRCPGAAGSSTHAPAVQNDPRQLLPSRCAFHQTGPIFANAKGKPLAIVSLTNRQILPALNRCEDCGKPQTAHQKAGHEYRRDSRIPERHGWHAARRGLGSNLYRLGVPDMVIQRILRHANVSTTATYYIRTAAADVRSAMAKLEDRISEVGQTQADTNGTLDALSGVSPTTIQ